MKYVSCGGNFTLRKWRFQRFNAKFISHFCGNECFGVRQKRKLLF